MRCLCLPALLICTLLGACAIDHRPAPKSPWVADCFSQSHAHLHARAVRPGRKAPPQSQKQQSQQSRRRAPRRWQFVCAPQARHEPPPGRSLDRPARRRPQHARPLGQGREQSDRSGRHQRRNLLSQRRQPGVWQRRHRADAHQCRSGERRHSVTQALARYGLGWRASVCSTMSRRRCTAGAGLA